MIIGVGTDIISVDRIKKIIETRGERFLNLIFTDNERKYCQSKESPWINYAGRFAAKESVFKVLKTGWGLGVRWKDVEILKNKSGEPYISLKGKTKLIAAKKRIKNIALSISHDRKYAMATAIGEDVD
ncbi:MAG: holo-ACP synthase [Candidatus Omnitrophica bacterium]|nr:holo-ACP synthase [Candidatus Omnitrophota bacterium]MBU1047897.1 holo-ACP synthase [Candidatus Omnitrophota bacterium]MBU1630785.1 holo-ACP synthase [Candidatus Omnitrophota bacterium]MBU1766957.1 holo-ACP synthase [Candidatus Omnitrophota bacterium]MBU1888520.1 holo-ACP synthase [Candidatus Omnitrophota bacterium]